MVFVKLLFRTRLTPVSFAYSRVVSSELLREHLRCELWRRQVLPSCWHLPSPSLPSSTLASKLSPLPKVPIVHLASPLAPTHLHGFFMYVNSDPLIKAVLYKYLVCSPCNTFFYETKIRDIKIAMLSLFSSVRVSLFP